MLFALSYISFLRGDIIIEQYEMCKWKCLKTLSQERKKQVQQSNQLSEENQDKERNEANRRDNESVRKIIEAYNNPFLLKYITMYWADYDSVESNLRMDQHFQQLTERELNQLSYTVCNKHIKSNRLSVQLLCRTYHKKPYPSNSSAHQDLKAKTHQINKKLPPTS